MGGNKKIDKLSALYRAAVVAKQQAFIVYCETMTDYDQKNELCHKASAAYAAHLAKLRN